MNNKRLNGNFLVSKNTTSLAVNIGGHSVAGRKPINQDAFAAKIPVGDELYYKGIAVAIADGISSCDDSHIASQTSVTSFISDYYSTSNSWSVKHSASRVLTGLNAWISQQNNSRKHTDMLCTFSAVVLKSQTLSWFHVGDTRIYHFHQGKLDCLTQDHAYKERSQTYLARALGGSTRIDVDYSELMLEEHDLILLTSDGVHESLSHKQISEHLQHYEGNPEHCCQSLVELALTNGSQDNLTAVLLKVESLAGPSLEESHEQLTALPIPPALEVGQKIDHFQVNKVIFSGTRSHMYQVTDLNTDELFILKAPSQNFQDDLIYLDGFVREEWVGQYIKHQNVMKTYASPNKTWLYYIAEFIEGTSVRQWMDDHTDPDLVDVRQIISQTIAGLRAFQRADMVHQDIKPENLMMEKGGRVVIIDFGTTRISGIDELASPLDKSLPQGSVGYLAPEYLMGETGTMQADLFSLAVVIYEMLVSHLPYDAPKQPNIKSYSDLVFRSASSYGKRLPVWIEACLMKALKANPNERYRAFSEFEQDFNCPNKSLVNAHEKMPLLVRYPIKTWQTTSVILLFICLIQAYWIHSQ